ncbi:MAG: hypothetical protein B7Z53_01160 [Rhodospirillales bacterium 12-71-4]|nr:MAG: hypothetical protein B7Z53_01160 [Rhodospirillales bacterium 12-71-4]
MRVAAITTLFLLAPLLPAQVIEFESGGLKYQTLTKNGVTIMYAHLAATVRDYVTLQVAVSNGTRQPVIIRPEDFSWHPTAGPAITPIAARIVVRELLSKARRDDVVGLVGAYENGLYGLQQLRSSSGYESRRRAALAEVESAKLKAAAAASAIAFVRPSSKRASCTFRPSGRILRHDSIYAELIRSTFAREPHALEPHRHGPHDP